MGEHPGAGGGAYTHRVSRTQAVSKLNTTSLGEQLLEATAAQGSSGQEGKAPRRQAELGRSSPTFPLSVLCNLNNNKINITYTLLKGH